MNLYRKILKYSNSTKISIWICIERYRGIWVSRFWLVDYNLPTTQDFDFEFRRAFRVSSSRERAVKQHLLLREWSKQDNHQKNRKFSLRHNEFHVKFSSWRRKERKRTWLGLSTELIAELISAINSWLTIGYFPPGRMLCRRTSFVWTLLSDKVLVEIIVAKPWQKCHYLNLAETCSFETLPNKWVVSQKIIDELYFKHTPGYQSGQRQALPLRFDIRNSYNATQSHNNNL